MLYLNNESIAKVLRMDDCINVQLEAFEALTRGAAVYRPRIDMYVPCDQEDAYYRWGSCEGASHGVLAIRMKSDILSWPQQADGRWVEHKHCIAPGTYCGLIFLFSTRDGRPLAIMQDGHLQHMRVGAAAGIGTRLLARKDSKTVGVIGSGGMARTYLEAICTAMPSIESARVYSPNPGNRQRFAQEMSAKLGIEVTVRDSAREAVRGADILSFCTDSMNPVIEDSWVEPGMHIVSLNTRECGPAVLRRVNVNVVQGKERLKMDSTSYFRKDVTGSPGAFVAGSEVQRRKIPKTQEGRLMMDDWPTYNDIATGEAPGRVDASQITHYATKGNWGVQFSSVGALVYRKASELGLGHSLPDEWFTQDIRN